MNLQKVPDEKLIQLAKQSVREEKQKTQEVLNYLGEIERRKLYLARGFASLFEFCTKELGYSESAAMRRIAATRVMRQIPKAKEKLENGDINLSTMSLVYSFIKNNKKSVNPLPTNKIENLIEVISGKNFKQCELELAKLNPTLVSYEQRERIVTQDLTEVKFMVTQDLKQKLTRIRQLLSHKNSNPTYLELFDLMADIVIKKLNPYIKNPRSKDLDEKKALQTTSRYIPSVYRQEVWLRDQGQCSFICPETDRKCNSKHKLSIDHIVPLSKGGKTEMPNLRLLCAAHNGWKLNFTDAKRVGVVV